MKALRLCYVGPAASITLRRWVEWFTARGHDATIVTVEPAEAALCGTFRQIDLGGRQRLRKVGRLMAAVRVARTIGREKPDVLHVHYLRGLAWGLLLKRWHPCVVTPWGSDILEDQGAFKEWYSKRLTCALLNRADLVTVHSAYMEERVQALAPSGSPMVRVGWGIDLRLFRPSLDIHPLRQRWGIAEHERVVFSPRLARRFYRHDRLIKALPVVLEKVPEVRVILTERAAEPGYVRELQHLASELGVADRITFVGSIPYEEMPLWYNVADAVVMLPSSDGMPNSLLEAMACGAVPILTRLPQYSEVITDGVNGFLVDPDGHGVADVLTRILSDPRERERMAMENRSRVAQSGDQELEMGRMEAWYRDLAGRHLSRPVGGPA